MYGAAGDDALDEQAPLRPVTPYAVSKVEAERALSAMASDGFSVTFLRNATAFGVSPRLRIDIVLNNLVGWAVTTGKIRILSDGTPWRPIVHIEDIAQATDIVLRAPRDLIHNEAFNIGFDSENYQVRELGAIVAKVVPGCEVEVVGQPGADPRNYRLSFAKFARRFPEFECRWTARKGAEQLSEAYTRHGLTLDTLQGRRYTRLKQLEYLLSEDRLDNTLRWH
jgi:nucleoside-diphosphate-sugar epimerase